MSRPDGRGAVTSRTGPTVAVAVRTGASFVSLIAALARDGASEAAVELDEEPGAQQEGASDPDERPGSGAEPEDGKTDERHPDEPDAVDGARCERCRVSGLVPVALRDEHPLPGSEVPVQAEVVTVVGILGEEHLTGVEHRLRHRS
ncbi:hypothetical protein [Curtobacterium sp. VKM Ac-1376]|uniref:hypothetical protein n=1 Tax=Curtobacterium sp. VKM Ac-1376 TaxID=123312 RepID=UPI00188A739C|nr:hypothetical protein [Curtobacterium sp. VKM Ac-1376]